jgi:hypothetical protein
LEKMGVGKSGDMGIWEFGSGRVGAREWEIGSGEWERVRAWGTESQPGLAD